MTDARSSEPRPTLARGFAPRRRTVVAAGSWSAPVVASALAAPLAAASGTTREMIFDETSYSATVTRPFPTITLRLSIDGRPARAGVAVRLVLPGGVTWADLSRVPRTLLTDGAGLIELGGRTNGVLSSLSEPIAAALTAFAVGYPVAATDLQTTATNLNSLSIEPRYPQDYPYDGGVEFVIVAATGDEPAPIGTLITVTPLEPGTSWSDGSHDPRPVAITEDDGTGFVTVWATTSINRLGEVRAQSVEYGSYTTSFTVAGFGRIWFEPAGNSAPAGELFLPFSIRTSDGNDNEVSAGCTVTLPPGYSWANGGSEPRLLSGDTEFSGDDAIRAATEPGAGSIEASGFHLEHGSGGLTTTSGNSLAFLNAPFETAPDAPWPTVALALTDGYGQPVDADVTISVPPTVSWDGVLGASRVVPSDRGNVLIDGLRSPDAVGPAGDISASATDFRAARGELVVALGEFQATGVLPVDPGSVFADLWVSLLMPGRVADPLARPITATLAGGPSWANGSAATRMIPAPGDAASIFFGDDLAVRAATVPGSGTLTLSGDAFAEPVVISLITRALGRLVIRPLQDSVPPGELYPEITVSAREADGSASPRGVDVNCSLTGGVTWFDGGADPRPLWVVDSGVLAAGAGIRAGSTAGTGVLTVTADGFADAVHTFRIA